MSTTPDRERIAKNFVRRYGEDRLRELIDRLSVGESGQQIAESFGVSREAVRKWKNTFGNIVTYYSVHPEVQRFMDRAQSDEAGASAPTTSTEPMIEIILDSSS